MGTPAPPRYSGGERSKHTISHPQDHGAPAPILPDVDLQGDRGRRTHGAAHAPRFDQPDREVVSPIAARRRLGVGGGTKRKVSMVRNVLITGGSSGIGRALVKRFATDEHEVWFTYRSGEARANELIASLPDRRVRAFAFDQGDHTSLEALLAHLPGRPDIAG